jgi:hypothetical protein
MPQPSLTTNVFAPETKTFVAILSSVPSSAIVRFIPRDNGNPGGCHCLCPAGKSYASFDNVAPIDWLDTMKESEVKEYNSWPEWKRISIFPEGSQNKPELHAPTLVLPTRESKSVYSRVIEGDPTCDQAPKAQKHLSDARDSLKDLALTLQQISVKHPEPELSYLCGQVDACLKILSNHTEHLR